MNARMIIAVAGALGSLSVTAQSFAPVATYPTANNGVREIAIADFSGDGILDVVACSANGDNVSVLFGNGDGTLGANTTYAAGDFTISVDTGDFDADGDVDFAVVNGNVTNVQIFYNDGVGGFGTSQVYQFDQKFWGQTQSIRAGDMDEDGDIDLVVEILTTDGIVILPNDGNGNFTQEVIIAFTPQFPLNLNVADFNLDGHLDIQALFRPLAPGDTSWVLLGNGDGTFQAPIETISSFSTGLMTDPTDLNGDMYPDSVFFNITAAFMQVLLGTGNGDLIVPPGFQDMYSVERPSSAAAADFNFDGNVDLVVSSWAPANTISVFNGNGDGTFQTPPIVYPSNGNNPGNIRFARMNSDDKLDVVMVIGGGAVGVMLNTASCLADTNEDGALSPADFSAWIAQFSASGPLCDQNGDGMCTPADFSAWIANFNDGCES